MHAYLMVLRSGRGPTEVLMAQKNVYLVPHGRYQFASIARNAVQYVIPGGRTHAGETPLQAALREFQEATNATVATTAAEPLCSDSQDTFFKVKNPAGVDVEAINLAIAEGRSASMAYNHFAWIPLETAQCSLGNKQEYLALPWVGAQVTRGLNAGFAREHMASRANEAHTRYLWALAEMVIDILAPKPSAATAAASATAPQPPAELPLTSPPR